MKGYFSGIATAIITPFYDNGGVNYEAFGKMIEYQIESGVDGIVFLGTTGEPATMTAKEHDAVMGYAIEKVAKRVKVIIGTGSNSTLKAVESSKKAESYGADALLVVTPYYNKCTQKGIVEYYRAVASAVSIPIICYNVPSRTGVNILPETMDQIADLPNVAGIKEASGNMAQACETMQKIRSRCDLYSGEDALNLPLYAIGAAGSISVVSNVLPKEVKSVYELAKAGGYERANELQDRLLPFTKACFAEVNPIPCKAAMNMIGFSAGIPREPLTELEAENKAKIAKELTVLGYEVNL